MFLYVILIIQESFSYCLSPQQVVLESMMVGDKGGEVIETLFYSLMLQLKTAHATLINIFNDFCTLSGQICSKEKPKSSSLEIH